MPDWLAFAGVAVVVSLVFVWLARASARAVRAALDAPTDPSTPSPAMVDRLTSSRALAGNVVASHGLVAVVLAGAAWFAAIPAAALGIGVPTLGELGLGVGLGVGLAAANDGAARFADRLGLDHDERLRALLAPDSPAGWAGLLVVVLPLVAIAEELLFRGALVGGLAAGFELPVWGLVVVSSVLFGLGHGLQGPGGVVVTTALGAALAAAFVVTGSLFVVIVAHYLVNAIEFVVNEWR